MSRYTLAVTLALAFVLGIVAGLRSMTPPAVVAWAAHAGWLDLAATPLAFLESAPARYLLLVAMLAELVADKLPFTPARTGFGPFAARIVTGGFAGAAVAAGAGGSLAAGAVAGALGAVVGTLGGYRVRTGLVRALRVPDLPIAIAADLVAVGTALLVVAAAA
jgi:uncharacterized membrane protein